MGESLRNQTARIRRSQFLQCRQRFGIFTREHDQLTLAFSFFYLNRCNRSGIVSGGCIGGLHQTGKWRIGARFPRSELIRRIELISAKRKFIVVKNCNAESFLGDYVAGLPQKTLIYCDPPYFHKAERLYLNHFQTVRRTRSKERVGAKYVRTYEKIAKTPYQRMIEHPVVPDTVREKLRTEHAPLNPLVLKKSIDTLTAKIMRKQRDFGNLK